MLPLHHQSASALAGQIAAGTLGARELLEHFLARIDRLNPALNAVIWQDREGARARADAAPIRCARGASRWARWPGRPPTWPPRCA